MNFRNITSSLLAATTLLVSTLPAQAGPFDSKASGVFKPTSAVGNVIQKTNSTQTSNGNAEVQGLGNHKSWVDTKILADDPRALCSDTGLTIFVLVPPELLNQLHKVVALVLQVLVKLVVVVVSKYSVSVELMVVVGSKTVNAKINQIPVVPIVPNNPLPVLLPLFKVVIAMLSLNPLLLEKSYRKWCCLG